MQTMVTMTAIQMIHFRPRKFWALKVRSAFGTVRTSLPLDSR